jgi:outer membrane protein TolC
LLNKGDSTLEQASADLTSLMDAEGQMRAQQRASLQTDYELNALLGLAPRVAIPIRPPGLPARTPDAAMRDALDTVAEHRPDLKALQAAYKSQEATLYVAVLRQFPSISVGFNTARDTSNVHTAGLGVTLDLPIFNGSRGDIAVQGATREQLHAEYQARLDQTHADIATLWHQTEMIRRQLGELQAQMPRLEAMADKARKPYAAGDFPALSYIALQSSLLNKKMEYIDLQQALWTNRIGLDTLLAWPLGATGNKED